MRRVIRWLITLALITFGLLWPLVIQSGSEASDIEDPVVFSKYKADFAVNRDGQLDAVERITAEFPGGRHGIFQWWDIANQNNPGLRQTPEITSILLDGKPVPYQMMWEGGERFRVAKIGDPDRTLTWGTHVFEIRYSIQGVLDPGTTGAHETFATATGQPSAPPSVYFWNVVAGSWNNKIERADISVTLPGDIGRVQCSVGFGVGRECRDVIINRDTVTFSAINLAPASRIFEWLVTEAKAPRVTQHEGIPAKVVTEVRGLSSTQVALDVYSHVTPRMQADATNQVAGLFGARS